MNIKLADNLKRYFDRNGARYLLILLVIYTFAMLGRSVWVNFNLLKQTDVIKAKIEETKSQNDNLANLIVYYKSDSFREVEARKKLGLKKPNEKVMTVPVQKIESFDSEVKAQTSNISEKKVETNDSNIGLWWHYLTK